jgi:hypothetical protein
MGGKLDKLGLTKGKKSLPQLLYAQVVKTTRRRCLVRSLWMYAWHCWALKSWCKWESTGIAENLLVLCNRFCNREILTCS